VLDARVMLLNMRGAMPMNSGGDLHAIWLRCFL
jgi:hypothetical protein